MPSILFGDGALRELNGRMLVLKCQLVELSLVITITFSLTFACLQRESSPSTLGTCERSDVSFQMTSAPLMKHCCK